MKLMQGWIGIVCCFVLFIVVCYSIHFSDEFRFNASDTPELRLLLFIVPGAVASAFSRSRRLFAPLLGAVLALPFCLLMMSVWLNIPRSLWQQLAWLFSGVFWSALGALGYLFIHSLRRFQRVEKRRYPF